MIVVDASAILAIYLAEPERERFTERIEAAEGAVISPVNYWEAVVRARSLDPVDGADEVVKLMAQLNIEVAIADIGIARAAIEAFVHFGRGTHANLNLGDCFAYALAKSRGAPLLFKGNDFARTDIIPV